MLPLFILFITPHPAFYPKKKWVCERIYNSNLRRIFFWQNYSSERDNEGSNPTVYPISSLHIVFYYLLFSFLLFIISIIMEYVPFWALKLLFNLEQLPYPVSVLFASFESLVDLRPAILKKKKILCRITFEHELTLNFIKVHVDREGSKRVRGRGNWKNFHFLENEFQPFILK